jgi:hypothetical protein
LQAISFLSSGNSFGFTAPFFLSLIAIESSANKKVLASVLYLKND